MSDSPHRQRERRKRALTWARRRAWTVLLWEGLWPLLWPAVALGAGFVALALLRVPQTIGGLFGGWPHLALLVGFLAAILWVLRRAVIRFRAPDAAGIRRRIETASGFAHRPLAALEDRPANSHDPGARAIWAAHLARLQGAHGALRAGAPRPLLARLDPYGLRVVIALLLLIGAVAAGPDARARLTQALTVDFSGGRSGSPPVLDAWISPPDYTGQPPRLLTGAIPADGAAPDGALAVPAGSLLLAAVSGGRGVPELRFDGGAHGSDVGDGGAPTAATPFETVAPGAHRIEARIDGGATLSIRQGGETLGEWSLNIVPDLPPTVALVDEPTASARGALVLAYEASDDYGVTAISATIRRIAGDGAPAADPPLMLSLPLSGETRTAIKGKSFTDLTPHPWAGQPVELVLEARDHPGQTAFSERKRLVLPARTFNHPVARAVIAQRQRLVTAPEDAEDIARVLMVLAARPRQYFDDLVVFLALKSASARLLLDASPPSVDTVIPLLWDTALRIEDGEVSIAARELRELERQLQEALANNAPDEEIERLMDALKQAIDRYMEAMAEQMRSAAAPPQAMEREPGPDGMRREDILDMVERARELMRSGARDAARQLLSQLQEMMENLRAGRMGDPSPQQQAFQEMMRQLRDLARRQQSLMDQTYRANQRAGRDSQGERGQDPQTGQGQTPPGMAGRPRSGATGRPGDLRPGQPGALPSGMTMAELERLQEDLRRALGEFMRKLGDGPGEIPAGLGQAERAMKRAGRALGHDQPGEALGPQSDALGHLRDGGRELIETLRERFANAPGQGQVDGFGEPFGEDGWDPLNRRQRPGQYGNVDTGDVRVPDQSDIERARRIFDELRRRSGDRARPDLELDYIDRLLRRF